MPLLLLNPYVDAILALALAFLASQILPAVCKPLFSIPVIGHQIEGVVKFMAQQLSYACGGIVSGVSDALGVSFHATARLIDTVTKQLEDNARALQAAVAVFVPFVGVFEAARWLLNHISHARAGDAARIKRLEKEYHGIDEQIKQIDQTLAKLHFKGIDAQLKSLQADINLVEGQTIPAINARVGTLDGAVGDIESTLGLPTTLPQVKWLAGFATAALAAIGLGGLSCTNFKNLFSKFGCGLGTLLNDLLGLMVAGLALEAVCDFLGLFEAAFGLIVGPVTHLLNEVPLGACEQPPEGWATLNVAAGPLPQPQSLGTFPD